MQQPSLCITATEPRHPEPVFHNQRSHRNAKPTRGNREPLPLATTRVPQTAAKTHCNQNQRNRNYKRKPQPDKLPRTAAKTHCNQKQRNRNYKSKIKSNPRGCGLYPEPTRFTSVQHSIVRSFHTLYIPLSCPQTRRLIAGFNVRDTTPENG